MGCGEARFGRKGQKTPKIDNFGLKVCFLGSQGDPHIRVRGNPRWELEATRNRICWCPLSSYCRLPQAPCGLPRALIAGCLELLPRVASSSVRVASSSYRGLPRALMCGSPRGPREQTLRPKFLILVPSRPSVDIMFLRFRCHWLQKTTPLVLGHKDQSLHPIIYWFLCVVSGK